MRILFLKSTTAIGYGYLAETVADIDDTLAAKFLRQNFAIPAPETVTPIPKDFPYRGEYLSDGVVCMEQIKALPATHSLNNSAVSYGVWFPKTKDLLRDYENRDNKKKPKQDVIY
jgi:hypothetical protein